MTQPESPAVSRETEKLHQYHALLLKWQERINLISPNTVNEAWDRHFADSLQLLPLIPETVKALYDLGAGAGFPGLVLAMAREDLAVTLIESDAKKCAFLQTVSRETGVAVTIENRRIEEAVTALPSPDVVTARALASLDGLLKYCRPWFKTKPDLLLIFPKGEHAAYEIEEARRVGWSFDVVETGSKTDRGARILSITKLSKRAE